MKLRVFNPLSEKLGFKEKEIRLDHRTRIKDITELSEVELDDYVLAINKMKVVKSDAEVSDTDELWILPMVDGG
ncbi:MAG: MoaD/ThiS family protein [Nitrososphaeria archaeon]